MYLAGLWGHRSAVSAGGGDREPSQHCCLPFPFPAATAKRPCRKLSAGEDEGQRSFQRIPFFVQTEPPVLNTESRSGQDGGSVAENKASGVGEEETLVGKRKDTDAWI